LWRAAFLPAPESADEIDPPCPLFEAIGVAEQIRRFHQ